MTTGRINQVTIVSALTRKGRSVPWINRAEQFTERGVRSPPADEDPGARLHGDLPTIQLPPLSFPKDYPPHRSKASKRRRRVWYRPLSKRIPSTGHVK